MALFSGMPGPPEVPAPSPTHSETVGDGYVAVDVRDSAEVGDENAPDGIPPEGTLKLDSECAENGVVGIDTKPEEGTGVVVSSRF